jgi:peroxiredoxin
VGVGFSDASSTLPWVEDQGYQYEIWTDDDERTLAMTYGAVDNADAWVPSRVSVLLDADGTLLLEYMDDVSAGVHPDEVLSDCQLLFGS